VSSVRPRLAAGLGRTLFLIALCCGSALCDGSGGYLSDRQFRRAARLASLYTQDNQYAALRLARYATGDEPDWDRRPEWNPPVEPLAPASPAVAPLGPAAKPLDISPGAKARQHEALRALGEAAFFRYPAQLAPYAARVLGSPAALSRYGFWNDGRHAGGVVRVALTDGSTELALSCATCHVRMDDSHLLIGAGNERLELGALLHDADRRFGRKTFMPRRSGGRVAWTSAAIAAMSRRISPTCDPSAGSPTCSMQGRCASRIW
jgi:hypothetical protein